VSAVDFDDVDADVNGAFGGVGKGGDDFLDFRDGEFPGSVVFISPGSEGVG
jgi:hypothetical protein